MLDKFNFFYTLLSHSIFLKAAEVKVLSYRSTEENDFISSLFIVFCEMEFKIFLVRYQIYDPNLQKLGMAVDKVLIIEFIKCFYQCT